MSNAAEPDNHAHTGAYAEVVAAYQGVEDPDRFSQEELHSYRAGLLRRTELQAEFIRARLPAHARVLEVGCGNGRLLIALSGSSSIIEGVGVDVSESRIEFARRWARDAGATALEFDARDVLGARWSAEHFDVALCITGAFAYFEPMRAGSALALLRTIHAALVPDGMLVLELYPHPSWQRVLDVTDGDVRLWQELPEEDRWRFYLSHLRLDADTGNLRHAKTFIHRRTGEVDEQRREHLRLYHADEIRAVLEAAGFGCVTVHGDWHGGPYRDGHDELLIVVGRKADGGGPERQARGSGSSSS